MHMIFDRNLHFTVGSCAPVVHHRGMARPNGSRHCSLGFSGLIKCNAKTHGQTGEVDLESTTYVPYLGDILCMYWSKRVRRAETSDRMRATQSITGDVGRTG